MTLRVWSVLGNMQRLDGGAMFGNAPRALWSRWIEPDAQHRIPLACRAMLVDDGERRILFETGIGAFFPPELRDRYGVVEPGHVLLERLDALGVPAERVDVVVLSHLHFDHAGGLLSAWAPDTAPELVFPRARFVVGREAWARALAPHARDRASYIPELPGLLEASGRLEIVDGTRSEVLGDAVRLHFSHGHTPGLLLAELDAPGGPIVFGGDLVPGRAWMHAPITMGYDRFPELLIDEKTALLAALADRGGRLFFTHDPEVAMAEVTRDARGRFAPGRSWDRLDGDPS
jgi:glyoxylase-like metal-dependent hydrolase (beta-lactamase superfamily II)